MNNTAIIYCRKSTDREDKQQNSLETQINSCQQIGANNNLTIVDVLVESKSAKKGGKRPIFESLIKQCKQSNIGVIIVDDPSRLSRNTEDSGKVLGLLEEKYIQTIYAGGQKFSCEQSTELFMLLLSFGMAKLDNDTRAKHTKSRMITCAERGQIVGKAPFGYVHITLGGNAKNQKKGVKINKKEAKVVQDVFEMRADKKTLKEISIFLKQKYNINFSLQRISKMLQKKFYIGMITFDGKVYQGKHDPIIPVKLFQKAQEVDNGFFIHKQQKPKKKTKPSFIFKGRIFDKNNIPLTAEIKKGKYIYYRTQSLRSDLKINISENQLNAMIAEDLQKVNFPENHKELIQEMLIKAYNEIGSIKLEYEKEYNNRIKILEKQQDKLLNSFLNDILDGEVYKKKNKKLEYEKILLQAKIQELNFYKKVNFKEKTKKMFELIKNLSQSYEQGDNFLKSTLLKKCNIELFINHKKELTIRKSKLLDVFQKTLGSATENRTPVYRMKTCCPNH